MNAIGLGRGQPLPLGATRVPNGVNFAVLSRRATRVRIDILHESARGEPLASVLLDEVHHRTGDHWHIRLDGLPERFCYGWRVEGPEGVRHRFDPSRVLLDPCGTIVSNGAVWGETRETDAERTSRRSLLARRQRYDWGDDAPLRIPPEDSIIYELHVRGFTKHPSSGVASPGTYRGLIEKLPYLKSLGITTLELLPVFEFDECDCPFVNPETGEKLLNYWGYNPIAFAAPKASYAANGTLHGQEDEFRDLVKACHAAGLEVILDVVFNHTGEGNEEGRTYHLRGLDNDLYYLMDAFGRPLNFSGCGNTVNCNHPLVREMILTCLRYWVVEMHVDGFRFDLASILGRGRSGELLANPPLIEMIADDGILSRTKLIAEPWDAGGAYQVGSFPFGERWAEWNDRYRDDVRRFWRGEPGLTGALASRISGSADLFGAAQRGPGHSINFLTCHDGFTLNDVVSYDVKHNIANGEGNRDGHNHNCSWNGGVEGETDDPAILELRERRAKSLIATLLLSQGTPMILGGDEFLRTQRGNNNAWCQDNELSWIDWTLAEKNAGFLRFVREVIAIRRAHPIFRRKHFLKGSSPHHSPDVIWHGHAPYEPDFGPNATVLCIAMDGRFHGRSDVMNGPDCDFYLALNGSSKAARIIVPTSPSGRPWTKVVDTSARWPRDVVPGESTDPIPFESRLTLLPFGLLLLRSAP